MVRQRSLPAVEADVQEVGRSIHEAFPTRTRHPLRALDHKAMELASQDQELRAALFRFVDVTPACRNLDDLARHLTAYLEEVGERPPPIAAAMRMSGTKPGRAALGIAAATGVRRMAHRFIVGETPKRAVRAIGQLWERGAAVSLDLLGEATVTQAEADRYAARCMDALETLAEAAPRWPPRPRWDATTRPGVCAPCCCARRSSGRTCTSTWSRWTRSRPRWTSSWRCSTSPSCATGSRPGW